MRPIDAEPSYGRIKLNSSIHGDGAYEDFKRIASEFYEDHTYKFVALTLDGEPKPDIVTFTAEFGRVKNWPEAPPPNDPLTLEQLREMDGEPVWVVQPGYKSSYGLVRTTWTVTMLVFNNGRFVAAEFAILEKGCKIFRRKPEEGTT